jgi:hypothetical protein
MSERVMEKEVAGFEFSSQNNVRRDTRGRNLLQGVLLEGSRSLNSTAAAVLPRPGGGDGRASRSHGAPAGQHPHGVPGRVGRRAVRARRVLAPPPGLPPPRRAAPGGRVPRRGALGLLLLRHHPGHGRLLPRVARRVQGRAPRGRPRAARPRPPRAPVPLHRGAPRQADDQSRRQRQRNPPRRRSSSGVQAARTRVPRFVRRKGRRRGGAPPRLPVQGPAAPLRAPRDVRRPHVLLLRPPPPLHRGRRRRARHGGGAPVRPAVPGVVAARLLGPAVEPRGARGAAPVGLRPRARARGQGGRRPGHVPRVRADARGHGVLPHPAPAHRGDGGVLPDPRRLLRGRGVVRGEGVAADAAAAGGDSARGGVRCGHGVLAVLPAYQQGRRGRGAAGGVDSGGGLRRGRRPEAVPVTGSVLRR